MSARERPTIHDVARHAGVSIGTVDRVVHDRGRVSAATAERVREAIRATGYSPNAVASRLSRATFHRFAAVLPYPEQDSGYWQSTVAGIGQAVDELAHHYVQVERFHFDRQSSASFEAALERARAWEPDGVLLAPTVTEIAGRFVREMPVPVVIFDGEVPDAHALCTVSQDSFESGLLAGRLMELMAGRDGLVTVTIGSADYHLRRRRDGFAAYFAAGGGATEIEHVEAGDPEEALAAIEAVGRGSGATGAGGVPPGGRPRGIFVTNALGHAIASAVNGASVVPHVPIICYDLLPDNAACLREGSLDFVINQEPWKQGHESVHALYRSLVLGQEVEPRVAIPVQVVMRENLELHGA